MSFFDTYTLTISIIASSILLISLTSLLIIRKTYKKQITSQKYNYKKKHEQTR